MILIEISKLETFCQASNYHFMGDGISQKSILEKLHQIVVNVIFSLNLCQLHSTQCLYKG